MSDLETAVLDILRKARPSALTLSDVHAHLVGRGWAVHDIPPHRIMDALIGLEDGKKIRNETSWRALADGPLIGSGGGAEAVGGTDAPEPKP